MSIANRSSRAELDLLQIWAFIAKDDPGAADRQLDRIDGACNFLAKNPDAGPRREDIAEGLRFFPVGNYLIFFTIIDGGIVVARVLHGARDYVREFED